MMRYEKKVTVLSCVLVALLAIWALGLVFSPERVAARSESARLVAGKAEGVASISLAAPGSPAVELAKSGSAWTLVDSIPGGARASFPVRSERVSSFLSDLSAVSRLKLAARSKDSWAGFKLDEAQAKRVTLKDASGKVLADLYFGGYGPTGSEVYLRRSGSDSTYIAETGVASYLDYGRPGWLDLSLFGQVKASDIQSFSVKSDLALGGKGASRVVVDYSARRDGQAWKAGATQLDAEAVAAFLRSIVAIQGEDYVASPPADAFAKPGASIRLELGDGKSLSLEVGAEAGANKFYARSGNGGAVAVVSSYSLKACLKSQAELAKR